MELKAGQLLDLGTLHGCGMLPWVMGQKEAHVLAAGGSLWVEGMVLSSHPHKLWQPLSRPRHCKPRPCAGTVQNRSLRSGSKTLFLFLLRKPMAPCEEHQGHTQLSSYPLTHGSLGSMRSIVTCAYGEDCSEGVEGGETGKQNPAPPILM